jgi:hypothetical protein
VFSRRIPVRAFACWMLLIGLLCSLPSAPQETTPGAPALPGMTSRVTITPGPLERLEDAQENTNPQHTTSSEQQGQQQAQQPQRQQQQTPEQQNDASHDRLYWALPDFLTIENAMGVVRGSAGVDFAGVGSLPAAA